MHRILFVSNGDLEMELGWILILENSGIPVQREASVTFSKSGLEMIMGRGQAEVLILDSRLEPARLERLIAYAKKQSTIIGIIVIVHNSDKPLKKEGDHWTLGEKSAARELANAVRPFLNYQVHTSQA